MDSIIQNIKNISIKIKTLLEMNVNLNSKSDNLKINTSGDQVKKLDLIAHDICIDEFSQNSKICICASEEDESPILTPTCFSGQYVIVFDPLDGSSNLECGVNVGSIFGVYKRKTSEGSIPDSSTDILQKGRNLILAGYIFYGYQTIMVISYDQKTEILQLNNDTKQYQCISTNHKMPFKMPYYSINESNRSKWDKSTALAIDNMKSQYPNVSLRWIGTMVADVHRTLICGGFFSYPSDRKNPNGRLRLVYECNPMAMIVENCGGQATADGFHRILDITPKNIHQKIPIFLGNCQTLSLKSSL